MGLLEEYNRKRHERYYGEGREKAERVKAGEEPSEGLDDFMEDAIGWMIPASTEYSSRRQGYKDEMERPSEKAAVKAPSNILPTPVLMNRYSTYESDSRTYAEVSFKRQAKRFNTVPNVLLYGAWCALSVAGGYWAVLILQSPESNSFTKFFAAVVGVLSIPGMLMAVVIMLALAIPLGVLSLIIHLIRGLFN